MSTVLTNEEKINIINQHIRNLEFTKYNIYLDLLQANSINATENILQEISSRQNEVDIKLAILESEKESLTNEGVENQ